MFRNHNVAVANHIEVLCKRNKCAYSLSSHSSPKTPCGKFNSLNLDEVKTA